MHCLVSSVSYCYGNVHINSAPCMHITMTGVRMTCIYSADGDMIQTSQNSFLWKALHVNTTSVRPGGFLASRNE